MTRLLSILLLLCCGASLPPLPPGYAQPLKSPKVASIQQNMAMVKVVPAVIIKPPAPVIMQLPALQFPKGSEMNFWQLQRSIGSLTNFQPVPGYLRCSMQACSNYFTATNVGLCGYFRARMVL